MCGSAQVVVSTPLVAKLDRAVMLTASLATSRGAFAQSENDCTSLPSYTDLKNEMGIAAGAGSGITGVNRGLGTRCGEPS